MVGSAPTAHDTPVGKSHGSDTGTPANASGNLPPAAASNPKRQTTDASGVSMALLLVAILLLVVAIVGIASVCPIVARKKGYGRAILRAPLVGFAFLFPIL